MRSETKLPVKDGWAYIREWDTVIGVSPKCGSGSIRGAINNEGLVYWKRADPLSVPEANRIFVVRHPLDRFHSLWRNKCRDKGRIRIKKNAAAPNTYHPLHGLTPEELFLYALDTPNHHWTPQSVLHAGTPCTVVRLEDMGAYWDSMEQTTMPYPKDNTTEGYVPMKSALVQRVMGYYDDDFKLWESAE